MMILLVKPSWYNREAPPARLVIAEVMAANRSASSRLLDVAIAINRPSDDTAIASDTPAVSVAKRSSNQLKLRASGDAMVIVAPHHAVPARRGHGSRTRVPDGNRPIRTDLTGRRLLWRSPPPAC